MSIDKLSHEDRTTFAREVGTAAGKEIGEALRKEIRSSLGDAARIDYNSDGPEFGLLFLVKSFAKTLGKELRGTQSNGAGKGD